MKHETNHCPSYDKNTIQKGDIWYIDQQDTRTTGTEIWSNRPAIIVSNDAVNSKAEFCNVVYLTTSSKRDMPYHIPVLSNGKPAIALCEQIFAVDKRRIISKMGKLSDSELLEIDKALLFSLGISNNIKPYSIYKKWKNEVDRYHIDLTGNPLNITNNKTDSNHDAEINLYKSLYESEKTSKENLLRTMESMINNQHDGSVC